MFDVWVFLGMGLLGYALQRLDFPLLPLVLGLILGQMAESNLSACWLLGQGSLMGIFERPVAVSLLILSLLSVIFSLRMRRRAARVAA